MSADPPRARRHRPRPDHQVRRLLPRPRRRACSSQAGSGVATLGIPSSPGCRRRRGRDTIVLPFNDVDAVAAAFASGSARGSPRSSSSRWPATWASSRRRPASWRRCARSRDARRAARLRRGDHRLPGRPGRRPGAASASGPTSPSSARSSAAACRSAAYGGRADLMDQLAPVGSVYQAGTLSGNPLAVAAGLSVLRRLRDPAVYARARAHGAPGSTRPAEAPMATTASRPRRRDDDALLRPTAPSADFEDAASATPSATARSSGTCSRSGIYLAPSQFEASSSRPRTTTRPSTRTIAAVGSFLGAGA